MMLQHAFKRTQDTLASTYSSCLDIKLFECIDYYDDSHFTTSIFADPSSIPVAQAIDLNMNHSTYSVTPSFRSPTLNPRDGVRSINITPLLNDTR